MNMQLPYRDELSACRSSNRPFKSKPARFNKVAGRATSFSLAAAASAALLLISGETGSGFALEGPKWPGATVPMVVQLGTPNFVLPDGFLSWDAAAENAMAQWNEQHGGVQF